MSTDAELQAAGIAVPKHTELPWTWYASLPYYVYSDGCIIAKTGFVDVATRPNSEQSANAQLIVAAVNAHDDLVAALKQLLPVARACKHEDFGNVDGAEWTRTEAIERSLAALRKAGAR